MAKSKKSNLVVADIKNLYESLKAYSKLTECAKLDFSQNGLSISGKNAFARGELFTNSITSENEFSICLNNLSMFIKLLNTAMTLNSDDLSEIKLVHDSPFIRIESKKFKTKLTTCMKDIIEDSIIEKIKSTLTPVFEFTTSSSLIKALNNHAFILPDQKSARLYLTTDKTMENNTLYATIGNRMNDMNNSVTMELGKINYGSIEGRDLIFDFEKLNIFNIVQSDSFTIDILERPFAFRKIRLTGENETYSEIMVICSFMVN